MKHVDVEMSQSATPATRNEATRRLKPPKAIAFAELATGTVILLSRRSLADTCERLKAQRTRFNPQTPKVKREPFAAFRNKCKLCCLLDVSGTDRKERNPCCSGASAAINTPVLKRGPSQQHLPLLNFCCLASCTSTRKRSKQFAAVDETSSFDSRKG